MTAPLSPGEPGRSQMSFGKGNMVHPDSDFQSQRKLPWAPGPDKHDATNLMRAQKRLDATNSGESVEDMYFAKGNPDAFGPAPPMVREAAHRPSGSYPQPELRYGVDRQE